MKKLYQRLSIHSWLLLLALVIALPCFALLAWVLAGQAQQARVQAYAQVQLLAYETAARLGAILRDRQVAMARLAARPLVKALDAKRCDPLIAEYISLNPELTTLAVRDLQGNIICSHFPKPVARYNPEAFPWYYEGLNSGKFFTSGAVFGPVSRRWVSGMIHPVQDAQGKPSGALVVGLDLLELNQRVMGTVPRNAVVAVQDSQGVFLLRSIDPESWIGKRANRPSGQAEMSERFRTEGSFTASSIDGVKRLYTVVKLPGTGWRVIAGVPEDEVLAPARAELERALAIGCIVLLLVLALAWRLASAIARPIRALAGTAARVAGGDTAARAHAGGTAEIVAVALQFNAMLEARKQAEAAHRDIELRLTGIVESATEAIISIDEAHRIFMFNAAAVEMFGCAAADAIGQPIEQFMPPAVRAGHAQAMRAFAAEPRASRRMGPVEGSAANVIRPVQARRADGQEFPVDASISHIEVQGQQIFTVILRDLSARLANEAAQASLEAQLRESQKMEAVGTLAGGIAHDFNNIIAAISGNAALAKKDVRARPEDALVSLEEIDKAAMRAKNLVQQILTFSRKQQQEFTIQPLRPLVTEAVRLLRATIPSGVEIGTAFADAPLHVRADAVQIEQVLVNLCINAWHAIEGSGRISIELTEVVVDSDHSGRLNGLASGRYVRIRVTDTGRGMDKATQGRIFEPFFTTKGVGVGTGLGLSVVHGIVSSHQGAITVESTPGKGSRFDVYLPVARQAPIEAVSPAPEAPALLHAQGQHVLYVDDDESMVFLVTRMLEGLGYRVSGFDRGEAALDAVRSNPDDFDLVVADFNMPGLSGLAVAGELRGIRPGLPVVITSGYITEELTASASALGVREVVYKPNTVDELCATIQRLLETAGA